MANLAQFIPTRAKGLDILVLFVKRGDEPATSSKAARQARVRLASLLMCFLSNFLFFGVSRTVFMRCLISSALVVEEMDAVFGASPLEAWSLGYVPERPEADMPDISVGGGFSEGPETAFDTWSLRDVSSDGDTHDICRDERSAWCRGGRLWKASEQTACRYSTNSVPVMESMSISRCSVLRVGLVSE